MHVDICHVAYGMLHWWVSEWGCRSDCAGFPHLSIRCRHHSFTVQLKAPAVPGDTLFYDAGRVARENHTLEAARFGYYGPGAHNAVRSDVTAFEHQRMRRDPNMVANHHI